MNFSSSQIINHDVRITNDGTIYTCPGMVKNLLRALTSKVDPVCQLLPYDTWEVMESYLTAEVVLENQLKRLEMHSPVMFQLFINEESGTVPVLVGAPKGLNPIWMPFMKHLLLKAQAPTLVSFRMISTSVTYALIIFRFLQLVSMQIVQTLMNI